MRTYALSILLWLACNDKEAHEMLRHFLQITQTRPRHWRGPAMLCVGLVLVSLWLWTGCEPPAQRTPPTPPPADTADTAPPEQAASSPPAAAVTPDAQENAQGPRFQQNPHTFSLTPWARGVIPPAVMKRERASYQHYEAKEISMDEHLENMYQLYREHLDGVTFVRELARRHGP